MLVADRPDFQVFMMERNANMVFGPGMWVFPGGSVDDTDDPARFQHISIRRSDDHASELIGVKRGGLAYYIAAIREAFEEAGILLALDRKTRKPVDLKAPQTAARFARHRDDINSGNRDFMDIIEEENLILDAGEMHYVARPPRRFDARFFVARMPPRQVPVHDDSELVHSRWLQPGEILRRCETEEMTLMGPTLRMVKSLARFDSAEDVIASASQNPADERARVNASREIVLPGDPGYDTADESIESGWIRLRPLSG